MSPNPVRSLHDRVSRLTSDTAVGLSVGFTVLILGLLACVVGYLLTLGLGGLSVGFFTRLPTGNVSGDVGGMKHAVIGTLILVGLASVVGIPTGVLTGVYLSEYDTGSWMSAPVRFVCDVLAGVPSIVVGILGYELLVRPLGHYNAWAGAAALAFIMVPIVARTCEEMLRLVPANYREASIGLGASKAETILKVVLPAATGSLVTGVVLAIARVAGETAPLLFTALGSRLLSTDPNEPMPSLTVQAFTYATGPSPDQQRLAWAGILVLIALIFCLNVAIRVVATRRVGGRR